MKINLELELGKESGMLLGALVAQREMLLVAKENPMAPNYDKIDEFLQINEKLTKALEKTVEDVIIPQ